MILVVRPRARTLISFRYKRTFKAPKGQPGQGSLKTGKKGKDVLVEVPAGTAVYEEESGEQIADLLEPKQRFVAARGGKAGKGNARFKSATHQAPREFEPGGEGEARWLRLELKLLADVGLVGLPNAGKSTFLSTVTKARPKIADYPFTTLHPHLGVVPWSRNRAFVLADIPGLIEGAHAGRGLGDKFLKHVERTRVLLHLVDLGDTSLGPVDRYRAVKRELEAYGAGLTEKPVIVVGTKADVPFDLEEERLLRKAAAEDKAPYYRVSSATHKGLRSLLGRTWDFLPDEEEP